MIARTPLKVLSKSEMAERGGDNYAKVVDFELNVCGKVAKFHIGITASRAKLADMVPLARTLSTELALMVLHQCNEDERFIACHKDCSACCSYLIPLSVPEIFCLEQELEMMPLKSKTAVLRSCLDRAKIILEQSREILNIDESTKDTQPPKELISKWYAGFEMACPFLSDGLCTIYQQRPLACREHIVAGTNLLCGVDEIGDPEVVAMPLSILEALAQLTAELEQTEVEAVMLPLAFNWAQDNVQRHQRSWPAEMMVKRFVEIVQSMALQNSTTSACSV